MKLSYLIRGTPGHPLHPPLTDATIGSYTFASVAAVVDAAGWSNTTAAHGWWLALLVGLAFTVGTALTGFVDWLSISRGTPLWRTATAHMVAMLFATAFFLISIGAGYGDGMDGAVPDGAFILTLVGFGLLTVGGWLGGTVVFHYGMRVLNLPDEPAARAMSPVPEKEKVEAAS